MLSERVKREIRQREKARQRAVENQATVTRTADVAVSDEDFKTSLEDLRKIAEIDPSEISQVDQLIRTLNIHALSLKNVIRKKAQHSSDEIQKASLGGKAKFEHSDTGSVDTTWDGVTGVVRIAVSLYGFKKGSDSQLEPSHAGTVLRVPDSETHINWRTPGIPNLVVYGLTGSKREIDINNLRDSGEVNTFFRVYQRSVEAVVSLVDTNENS